MPPAKILVPVIGMASFAILLLITLITTLVGVIAPRGGVLPHWLLITCFGLSWYNLSTAWLAQRVTYPLFGYVGRDSFAKYHATYDGRIVFPVILPAVLLMNASVLLVWCHPTGIPSWSIWTGVSLQLIIGLSTACLQVPAHRKLELKGFSREMHSELISTNWIRTAAYSVYALITTWLTAHGLSGT